MTQTIRSFLIIVIFTVLSGCLPLIKTHEPPKIIGDREILSPLIGRARETVVEKLGIPNEEIEIGEEYYMVYSSISSVTHLAIIFGIPVYAGDPGYQWALHCLRFELDSNKLVKGYDVESTFLGERSRQVVNRDCRRLFWEGKELESMHVISESDLEWSEAQILQKAGQGSAYAQFQLYKSGIINDPDTALEMLCQSADQGHMEARYTLGNLFRYGKRDFLEPNYIQAYMWYSLSGYMSKEEFDYFVETRLSDNELVKAKKLLQDWQPGQCEKSLGLNSGIQQMQ